MKFFKMIFFKLSARPLRRAPAWNTGVPRRRVGRRVRDRPPALTPCARRGYAAVAIFDVPVQVMAWCAGCPGAMPSALAARAVRPLLTRARYFRHRPRAAIGQGNEVK